MAGCGDGSPSEEFEGNEWSDFTSNSTATNSFDNAPFGVNSQDPGAVIDTIFSCFSCSSESLPAGICSDCSREPREGSPIPSHDRVLDHVDPSLALYGDPLVWRGSRSQTSYHRALNLPALGTKNHVPSWLKETDSKFITNGTFDFHKLAEKFASRSSTQRWSRDSSEVPEDFILSKSPDALSPTADADSNEQDEIFLVFRGKPNSRPSSFDECQAAAGLSELSPEELLDLREEMSAYVKEYSDILIEELTLRDELDREKEIKNKFISVLLAVQSRIREVQTAQGKGKKSSSANSGKFITTVIPYDDCAGGPSTKVLLRLIEIMEALIADSPIVPGLLTEYILKVLCAED